MKNTGERAGENISFWERTAKKFYSAPLSENLSADVCVIGAGIAGVNTAYSLAREDRHVVLVDDGPVGGGMTGRTTAHLVTALDDRYSEIEKILGEECARGCAESHTAAINWIEAIVAKEKIDCDFERVDGYLFLPPGGSAIELKREVDAAIRAGLRDIERVDRVPIGKFNTEGVLRFPRQAQFHPLKYLDGLAHALPDRVGLPCLAVGAAVEALELVGEVEVVEDEILAEAQLVGRAHGEGVVDHVRRRVALAGGIDVQAEAVLGMRPRADVALDHRRPAAVPAGERVRGLGVGDRLLHLAHDVGHRGCGDLQHARRGALQIHTQLVRDACAQAVGRGLAVQLHLATQKCVGRQAAEFRPIFCFPMS